MKYLETERFASPANSDAYRDGWERTFGEAKKPLSDSDSIECSSVDYGWWCEVCRVHIYDPENHRYHAVIKLD